jgi:hypothetical protein
VKYAHERFHSKYRASLHKSQAQMHPERFRFDNDFQFLIQVLSYNFATIFYCTTMQLHKQLQAGIRETFFKAHLQNGPDPEELLAQVLGSPSI